MHRAPAAVSPLERVHDASLSSDRPEGADDRLEHAQRAADPIPARAIGGERPQLASSEADREAPGRDRPDDERRA